MLQAETKAMSFRMAQTYGFTAEAAFKSVKGRYKILQESSVSDFLKSFSEGLTQPVSQFSSGKKRAAARSVKKYDAHAVLMNAIIRRMDLDGTGHVTLDEFRRAMGFSCKVVMKKRQWLPFNENGVRNSPPVRQVAAAVAQLRLSQADTNAQSAAQVTVTHEEDADEQE